MLEPLGAVLFDWINIPGFEPQDDQVVGPFDLTVTPWVRHRGIVDVDAAFLAKILELGAREGSTQISDDPVKYPKPMGYFLNELGCLGY